MGRVLLIGIQRVGRVSWLFAANLNKYDVYILRNAKRERLSQFIYPFLSSLCSFFDLRVQDVMLLQGE